MERGEKRPTENSVITIRGPYGMDVVLDKVQTDFRAEFGNESMEAVIKELTAGWHDVMSIMKNGGAMDTHGYIQATTLDQFIEELRLIAEPADIQSLMDSVKRDNIYDIKSPALKKLNIIPPDDKSRRIITVFNEGRENDLIPWETINGSIEIDVASRQAIDGSEIPLLDTRKTLHMKARFKQYLNRRYTDFEEQSGVWIPVTPDTSIQAMLYDLVTMPHF